MSELASQPTTIQSVYSWYRGGKLYVNRRYQRKLVWTLLEKKRLIESILKKYPIPAILIAERPGEPGTYEIIDGLQRLHAITSFIETSFSTTDEKYFDVSRFPTASSYSSEGLFEITPTNELLGPAEVSILLDYTLGLSVMRSSTDEEIDDVFGRINTYGHRLSDQERRQAGVRNEFSELVRSIACTLRGDASENILLLSDMPSISIDLPKSKHGYEVRAEDVFWVSQGILRSTDLRDSMDEQCIADISACILGGQLIERSKVALDKIYDSSTDEFSRIQAALEVYGPTKFAEEFKYCIDQILAMCSRDNPSKLRAIIFAEGTTNAFPSVFAAIFIAFHELIVGEQQMVSDFPGLRSALTNLDGRINTGRQGASSAERRRNVDSIKGLIRTCFIRADIGKQIYGNHATTDIESIIRRSEIELADYELKQGVLSLDISRNIDKSAVEKIIRTLCAIANNGPGRSGKIILGVTDKDADANRIRDLDGVEPKRVGKRYVVGISREASQLSLNMAEYVSKWRDWIKHSQLSSPLREGVLSSIDFNDYFGYGLLVLTIPPQSELSYVGDSVYWRSADSTELADTPKLIASLAKRF
jgi:hypothetical protein